MTGVPFGLPTDPMPEALRLAYESEQRRLDALDRLSFEQYVEREVAAIRTLPESTILDWRTEPGEYLR